MKDVPTTDVASVDPRSQLVQRIKTMDPEIAGIICNSRRFQILPVEGSYNMNWLLDCEGGLEALRRMCTSEELDGNPIVQLEHMIRRLQAKLTAGTSKSTS